MRYRNALLITAVTVVAVGLLPLKASALFGGKGQAAIVAEEIAAFSGLLAVRPSTAIDLSKVSGEYCFQVNLGKGGHMTHFAIDPLKTKEDVVDFVNAAPLIEAGLDVTKLKRFPGKLGAMEPNVWYYLPAGELEPHHGRKFPFPLLIKAVNLK